MVENFLISAKISTISPYTIVYQFIQTLFSSWISYFWFYKRRSKERSRFGLIEYNW